jgi:hypothetical protein
MNKKLSMLLPIIVLLLSAFLAGSAIDFTAPNENQAITGGTPHFNAENSVKREGNKLGPRQTVVDSVPAPGSSHMGLGFDGMYLWHASNAATPITCYQIDTSSGSVVSTITTGINSYVLGVTYLNGSLWIQEWYSSGTTYEIDPNTGTVLSSFTSPGGTGSRGLTNDGTYLWIFATGGATNNGTAYQVTTTGTLVHSCDISGPIQWPMGASYDNQRGTHFVNDNSTANDINELDCSGSSAVLVSQFAHPDAGNTPEGITYDGQFLWTVSFYGTWIYKIDIGDPPPAPPENILFVDDDAGQSYETYWETSFGNLGYPYDKWCVTDSSNVAPDSADMSVYTIVVWTTGYDMSTTLTATDTTELDKWLAAGGKLWLSSQDVLWDLGTSVSWMHLVSYNNDVGADSSMGIGPVMGGTAFQIDGGVFTDYADNLVTDGVSWAELVGDDYDDTIAVAIDTSAAEPYFVFFNAFGWENIGAEADRDTMMERVLSWMNYAPPPIDAAAQSINWPGTSVLIEANGYPAATFRNAGMSPITFDVHFEIDTNGVNVYTGAVQSIFLDVGGNTTWVFTPDWTAGSNEGIVYDVTAYTVMPGDDDPSNDTVMQTTITTSVSAWIQCANRPAAALCHASCYDPVGDYIYAFGGGDGYTYYNYNYRYDPNADSWTTLAAIPVAINWIDASAAQWNRKIYIFGGYDGSFHNYNYIYDIVGNSWSTGAAMPSARIAGGQVIYNDSLIYFLCGHNGSAGTNTVYIYDTYLNTWTTGTTAPTTSYMQAQAILGDTIWLIMTYNGSSCNSTMYRGIIDPANCQSITWSTGPSLPVPNFNGGGTSMYRPGATPADTVGKLFEVGGFENAATPTPHAWEYDMLTSSWIGLPDYPMTIVRNDFLAARTNGDTMEIYVNGGDNSGGWTMTAETWKLKWQPPAVGEEKPKHTLVFGLAKITPNPVNGNATIAYTTTEKGPVSLKIYDASGRLVRTLVDAKEDAGNKTVHWNGKDNNGRAVSAGIYFYRLTAENRTVSEKMVVVK